MLYFSAACGNLSNSSTVLISRSSKSSAFDFFSRFSYSLKTLAVNSQEGSHESSSRFCGCLPVILGVADTRLDGFGGDEPLVDLQILHGRLHDLQLIGVVVDREVARVAKRFDFAAKNPHAEGMESRNQRIARTRGAQQIPHAKLHLVGGFVGEGDGEDLVRADVSILDQMRDAIGNDARFAAACACQDQDRPFSGVWASSCCGLRSFERSIF